MSSARLPIGTGVSPFSSLRSAGKSRNGPKAVQSPGALTPDVRRCQGQYRRRLRNVTTVSCGTLRNDSLHEYILALQACRVTPACETLPHVQRDHDARIGPLIASDRMLER